jgi:hypothetical protein
MEDMVLEQKWVKRGILVDARDAGADLRSEQ